MKRILAILALFLIMFSLVRPTEVDALENDKVLAVVSKRDTGTMYELLEGVTVTFVEIKPEVPKVPEGVVFEIPKTLHVQEDVVEFKFEIEKLNLEIELTEELMAELYSLWHTGTLTANKGYITDGPSGPNGNDGYETWYDLDMTRVVEIMRTEGYDEIEYPYWINEETGCKMLGEYIMVAGDIVNTRKRGDIIETSLGKAMVCDYCEKAVYGKNHYWIDIATDWEHTYSQRVVPFDPYELIREHYIN